MKFDLIVRHRAAIEEVRRQHGRGAFVDCREATAQHEAGHAVVATAEGLMATRLELFHQPIAASAAGSLEQGFRLGQYFVDRRYVIDAHSDPILDLRQARVIIAGRAAEMLSAHGLPGAALDEMVLSQWMADAAARKLGVDGGQLWGAGVWRPALAACRLNRATIDKIARQLLRRGVIDGSRLQSLLRGVRRLGGIFP